jgi:hypothetical protein
MQTKKDSNKNKHFERVRVLFDSGCAATLVNHKFLKKLKKKQSLNTKWTTKAGTFTTTAKCKCMFSLPEFHENRDIIWDVYVDSSSSEDSRYDMIVGRDLMNSIGLDLKFSDGTMTWDNASVPMRSTKWLESDNLELYSAHIISQNDPIATDAERIQSILDVKYAPASTSKMVSECTNLTKIEQEKLHSLLDKYDDLFDGTLGTWKTTPVELELKPDATPHHSRAYPVPHSQEKQLREEVERMVKLGVMRKVNRSEWASPAFTIAKKDNTLRSIADLRELNKRIKRKPYPIPKIQDMLLKLEGFLFATSLDLNMGYYHIRLTPLSSSYCTVIFPWGKYEYLRLPMGLCNSPDIFQEKMGELFYDLEYVRAYIDDLLVITNEGDYDTHLQQLESVFKLLRDSGLKVNATKSFFCKEQLEYLGYWITREGIQPLAKKVEAILNIAPPETRKQLRRFIGMINYYRDMWIRRAHTLAPLTGMTSAAVKWEWTAVHQKAFETIKRIMARETLLTHPNFQQPFHVHADASKLQLGSVISQSGKPLAFYSRKLLDAQTRYTTTERELLSIVETLKEFRTILLGQELVVHTDHSNLTYANFTTDRVIRWRLYLEEYSPDIRYIKGESNIVADALSRLELSNEPMEEAFFTDELRSEFYYYGSEAMESEDYALTYEKFGKAQSTDKAILKELKKENTKYRLKEFTSAGKIRELICYGDKIVIPAKLQQTVVHWYHHYLAHPGINRTEETIGQHLWWPNMRTFITDSVSGCAICQRNKKQRKKYGLLPEKIAESIPWDKLCIDLIGPYKIRRKDGTTLICRCVTMIDPATGWFEIHQYQDKRSITVANIAEQEWFSRYPWPTQVTYDRGSEFIGHDFRDMLVNDYGIKRKPITVRNPQANAIVERVHQVIGNIIRTFELQDNYLDEEDPWKGILSATAFAVRATYHTTLQKTPGQLVFGRDMIFNVKHAANWEFIRARKQNIIKKNNKRENAKRTPHTYRINDKVMLKIGTENKYETPYKGPFKIQAVNTNGTVRLKMGAVIDTVNIRRLQPFREEPSFNRGGECSMRTSRRAKIRRRLNN